MSVRRENPTIIKYISFNLLRKLTRHATEALAKALETRCFHSVQEWRNVFEKVRWISLK